MRSRKSPAEVVTSWLLIGLLLIAGFSLALFRAPLLSAAGLARSGAPTTVEPSLFEPSASRPAAGTGLIQPAPTPAEGMMPNRSTLEGRLGILDASKLVNAQKQPVAPAYSVVDVATGETVAARSDGTALIPASNTKLLTSVAVLNRFRGDETFATTVVQPEKGKIVLVGGGDPMLAAEPAPDEAYPKPASTRKLAEATAKALKDAGQTSVSLGYDASLFEDSGWAATWPDRYASQVTRISALWTDEGMSGTTRSATPALDAAKIFATQLKESGITVDDAINEEKGTGDELARVESLPVHVLVEMAMQLSNNSYTEVLGFQLALADKQPASFAGSAAAIQAQLTSLGLWRAGAHLVDASGLSRENVVTASMLAGAVRTMATEPRLSVILDGLPTAGVTGTLADRFTDHIAKSARGIAHAKTGTLNFVSTLAGTTRTADGRQLAFAFLLNGQTDGWAAKVWSDQAVGVVTSCGCS